MNETKKTPEAEQVKKPAKKKTSPKGASTQLIKLENFVTLANIEKSLRKDQLAFIKKTAARNIKTLEHLYTLIYRSHVVGADLLRGEMIGYTDSKGNLVTITTKDFMLRKAHQTGLLAGIKQEAIYVNENKERCDFWAQGAELVGATAEIARADANGVFSATVKFSEYDKRQSLWKTIPETMIKKVALTHALRLAFPNELGGVYDESEIMPNGKPDTTVVISDGGASAKPAQIEKLKEMGIKIPEDLTIDGAVDLLMGGKK